MFYVYDTTYHKDGKMMIKGKEVDNFRVEFVRVGTAKNMVDAKKKFKSVKNPVIEEVIPVQHLESNYWH